MKTKLLVAVDLVNFSLLNPIAQEVELDIDHSVKVRFDSEKGKTYPVYSTTDPDKRNLKFWEPRSEVMGKGLSFLAIPKRTKSVSRLVIKC